MRGSALVDGTGTGPVHAVVRQLWGPLLGDPGVRVVLGGALPGWRVVEAYRVVPDARSARFLVPAGHRRLAAAAVLAYQGLRPARMRGIRALVGAAAWLGVPLGRDLLTLQVRVGAPEPQTPRSLAASAVGHPGAAAAVGVREGANAKATLQLFAPAPVGFAKVAWDPQSAGFVEVERAVLESLRGGSGLVRVPALLGSGSWGGFPYLVTEPLPAGVRRPGAGDGPSPAELLGLAAVVREDVPIRTSHLRALAERVNRVEDGAAASLLLEARALLGRVAALDHQVSVVERWHGDLVPWNVARDSSGTLWVWDWETAEQDVVLGLDAVHWSLHAPVRPAPDLMGETLTRRLPQIRETVAAMGGGPGGAEVAVAVHALAMVDRGLALAAARGGWGSVLVGVEALRGLTAAAARVI